MEFQSLQARIDHIASTMPDKAAMEYGDRRINYAELKEKSDIIAALLGDNSCSNENIIVYMGKCPELVISILGIMKNGCVFAPISPDSPEGRQKVLIDSIKPTWAISTIEHLAKLNDAAILADIKLNTLVLETDAETSKCYSNLKLFFLKDCKINSLNSSDEIKNKHLYIYFTSGSTGQPKGILGRHRSLKHFIEWEIKEFGVNSEFNVSQLTAPTFDPYLRDVFIPLCVGGTLHIPQDEDILLDAERLEKWLDEKRITLVHTVPSVFKNMTSGKLNNESLKNLRYILLAGEMLRGNDIKPFVELFGDRIQLVNLYGPTETTLAKFFYRINTEDRNKARIPVGRPISHTEAMILDNDMNRCQTESIGEIYIRTPFITSGYIGDKDMTRKVFIRNPFSDNPQDIIYKTGDLGKMNLDGNIEIIGRIDHQVKIRGVRIELAEIERVLLEYEGIMDAVVVAYEDEDGEKHLCAYFVEKTKISSDHLRSFMGKQLPEHMIPLYFVPMDKLPLLPNGKVDRKSLPKPETRSFSQKELIAPRNETEEKLAHIWKEILKKEDIGVEDSFFHIGGHSLRAAGLVAAVKKELGVQLSIKEVFRYTTIAEMAAHIKSLELTGQCQVEKTEESEYYPVSPSQRRLYILSLFDENSINYNMPFAMMMEGRLDKSRFDRAVREIVNRHEILRTSFENVDGVIVQKVHNQVDFQPSYTELPEEELEGYIETFIRPFDLNCPALIRVCLVRVREDKHLVMFDMHHIISDGTSIEIIIKEFVDLYEGKTLPGLTYQYNDYAAWQNRLMKSDHLKRQEEYWVDTFSKEVPVLDMPGDFTRPNIQSFEGGRIQFEIDKELTAKIRNLGINEGTTLYMTLLAAFNVLLFKYTGQEDIIVGSPISGRKHTEFENLIGMFVNTLALRNSPDSGKTFKEFLQSVKKNTLDAFDNDDYQFEELVERLNLKRDLSRNPLFDVMFALQNFDRNEFQIEGLSIKEYKLVNNVSKFDIVLTAFEAEEKLKFHLTFCTKIFCKHTMDIFAKHYSRILQILTDDADIKLSDIDMLSQIEKEQILHSFNNTKSAFPSEKTINQLFQEQAERTPDNVAVIFEGEKLTYRQLNAKANQLARRLIENGIEADSIVGIISKRSLEMVIGILGVLKAGGAYLPIDPSYPKERIHYILQDSSSSVVLVQNSDIIGDIDFNGCILNLDSDEAYAMDETNLSIVNKPENLAYIIYTSGSTGNPKGVMIEHRSLVNRLNWMQKAYPIGPGDVILQKTPYTFDVSVWELLWWSLQGAAVSMLIPGGEKNPEAMIEAITDSRVTTMHFVPSMLNSFLNYLEGRGHVDGLKSLKQVFASGEALTLEQVERFNKLLHKEYGTKLHNLYGPTEAAIDVSYFDCSTGRSLQSVPIGKPIDNIELYILDKNLYLQPVGVPGELHIAGVGLARGYLNRPELTAEKFIASPFVEGERIYKTGDLAKWRQDGNIEYIGRIDHQVKIRGFRIELGEIEEVLRKNEIVKETVVVPKEDKSGNKYLCAYIVSDNEFTVQEMKSYLGKELPEYMIPSYFVRVEKMPLSSNGKVDRKALPEPQENINTGVSYIAPRNENERVIAELWKEVLNVDTVGVEDNFFDIGGNSIRLVDLYSKLDRLFPGKLKVADLFSYTRISELAAFLSGGRETKEKMEFKLVSFPPDYFVTEGSMNEACSMYLTIEDDIYEKLKDISAGISISNYKILLAAYLYLLSDITGESKVSICTLNDEGNAFIFLETDVEEIESLTELFKSVKECYESEAANGGYPTQQLGKEILNKGNFETISLIYEEGLIPNILNDVFDIKVGIDERGGSLRLSCEYNAKRLKKESIEILLSAYVKLIKIIVENL